MTPLVSFIVTYHNEPEAYLQACLESISALPLDEGEAEIIVVDDGSRNQIKIQDTKVKVIRQDESGLSVARNTGIEAARGRYIQFVDADDCLIPDAYRAVLELVRGGEADVLMFGMRKDVGNNRKLSNREIVKLSNCQIVKSSCFLQHRNLHAAACGYAFRREVLGSLRFCPGLLHEDELFTPQLFLRASTIIELDVKAYFYRQHEGTITHARSSEKIKKRLDDIHFILCELRSLGNPLLERRICQLTVDYLQRTWTLTHSFGELRRRSRELRREHFLPLPVRSYSPRYLLASLVCHCL